MGKTKEYTTKRFVLSLVAIGRLFVFVMGVMLAAFGGLCAVMVGGAVLTQDYADMIGADHYAPDAMDGVRYAESVFFAN